MGFRLLSAVALSVGIVLAAWLLADAWTNSHPHSSKVSVTGLAQKDFDSDLIVWRSSFERKGASIRDVYPLIRQDAERVRTYLERKGIAAKDIVINAVVINEEFRYVRDQGGDGSIRVPDGYRLYQNVTVESRDIDRVVNVSREVSELIDAGVQLNSYQPEYYFSKLSELKMGLLADAAADGRERAERIAEKAGGSLGGLLRADMGIFQITGVNSNEDYSWGGTFNTTSRRKTATVTVKMEFSSK
jgi:hypothetical protein